MRAWQWMTLLGAGTLLGAAPGTGASEAVHPDRRWPVAATSSFPAADPTHPSPIVAAQPPAPRAGASPAEPGGGPVVRGADGDARPGLEAVDAGASPASEAACPEGMIWVHGEYCTEVRQTCREWLDDASLPFARCARFESPSECVGRRVAMSFCIDRFEYARPGDTVPANQMSFELGSKACQQLGRRICAEREWNFACEGEEMLPYPYGYAREPFCNQDRDDLLEMAFVDGVRQQVLKDLRRASSLDSACVSPFGIYDMVGNLDEPVLREATQHNRPFRNALKGGWWMASRNRCRPATTSHDDWYQGTQVGARCCADVAGTLAPEG